LTEVSFYTGVADPLGFAVRLTAKLQGEGRRVRLLTQTAKDTSELDARLWTDSPVSFIPHCRLDSPQRLHTPVWLGDEVTQPDSAKHADVLINCANEVAPFFARFLRVVEIIATEPTSMAAGRIRFAYYKNRGYDLKHFDMLKKVPN
jgi:DNA polymerase III subunit chi